jgi:hypothetical protein
VFGEGKAQAAFARAYGRRSDGALALRWSGVRQFIVTRPANITRPLNALPVDSSIHGGVEFGAAEQSA